MDKQLSDYTTDELRAALVVAEERDLAAREAKFPKCACGKPATYVSYPVVEYRFRRLRSRNGNAVICSEMSDSSDVPPGEGGSDDLTIYWVACDAEECQSSEWRAVEASEYLTWG